MLVYYWKKFDKENLPEEGENLENLTLITVFYPHYITKCNTFYPHFVTNNT
jgi:hypothetical protein